MTQEQWHYNSIITTTTTIPGGDRARGEVLKIQSNPAWGDMTPRFVTWPAGEGGQATLCDCGSPSTATQFPALHEDNMCHLDVTIWALSGVAMLCEALCWALCNSTVI